MTPAKAKAKSKAKPRRPSKPGPDAGVDAYLAAQPADMRRTLQRLRQTIRAAAPQAQELISYRIPAYKQQGPLVFFAAFRNHCSLFAVSRPLLQAFARQLAPFEIAGTTIHFSPDHPLPAGLVKQLVQARLKQNQTRANTNKH